MKTPSTERWKDQLIKVFWVTIAWTLISVYQFFLGYATIEQVGCEISGQLPALYFQGSILTGLLAGILGGSILVFAWEKWLRTKKYGTALLYMLLSYSILYFFVSGLTALFFYTGELPGVSADSEVFKAVRQHVMSFRQLHSYIFWLIIIIGTLIVFQVNDKYGPGVFRAFLMGKYFHAQREERIFMFLDLRSSTSIAEKLGEERYFNFIRRVFENVTPAILANQGEIYQYVGDEIVISWKMKNGLQEANCIRCFFQIQAALAEQRAYYTQHYDGIHPEFKAGLHYGHVMAGEVGVVKREIVFSGDVLNTTARIQSKCNDFGVDILLSKFLLDKLRLKAQAYTPQIIGEMRLRGKEQKVVLYTL